MIFFLGGGGSLGLVGFLGICGENQIYGAKKKDGFAIVIANISTPKRPTAIPS